jgi:hypothetical protein
MLTIVNIKVLVVETIVKGSLEENRKINEAAVNTPARK